MDEINSAPLRSSCDWCRTQKLRCAPTSKSDATAPCQRCLKARPPRSCVFSRRSRSGRSTKSGMAFSAGKYTEGSTTSQIPGLSTFALSVPSQPDLEIADSPDPPRIDGESCELPHDGTSATAAMFSPQESLNDWWQQDIAWLDPLYTDSSLLEADHLPHADASTTSETTPEAAPISPRAVISTTPSLVANLSSLLADMHHYESLLSAELGTCSQLENYPVGDAIALSQRFFLVLSSRGQARVGTTSASHPDMSTMLLSLSCYITLTRIHYTVFDSLRILLTQLQGAQLSCNVGKFRLPPVTEIESYRGLCLGQLQSVGMDSGWDTLIRVKRVVSMLLDLRGRSEDLLRVPPDLKIVATSPSEVQWQPTDSGAVTNNVGFEEAVSEEGMMMTVANGRLHRTIRKQAVELQGKVDEVDDLLKKVLLI